MGKTRTAHIGAIQEERRKIGKTLKIVIGTINNGNEAERIIADLLYKISEGKSKKIQAAVDNLVKLFCDKNSEINELNELLKVADEEVQQKPQPVMEHKTDIPAIVSLAEQRIARINKELLVTGEWNFFEQVTSLMKENENLKNELKITTENDNLEQAKDALERMIDNKKRIDKFKTAEGEHRILTNLVKVVADIKDFCRQNPQHFLNQYFAKSAAPAAAAEITELEPKPIVQPETKTPETVNNGALLRDLDELNYNYLFNRRLRHAHIPQGMTYNRLKPVFPTISSLIKAFAEMTNEQLAGKLSCYTSSIQKVRSGLQGLRLIDLSNKLNFDGIRELIGEARGLANFKKE